MTVYCINGYILSMCTIFSTFLEFPAFALVITESWNWVVKYFLKLLAEYYLNSTQFSDLHFVVFMPFYWQKCLFKHIATEHHVQVLCVDVCHAWSWTCQVHVCQCVSVWSLSVGWMGLWRPHINHCDRTTHVLYQAVVSWEISEP